MGQSAHLHTPALAIFLACFALILVLAQWICQHHKKEVQVPPIVNSCNSRLLRFDVFNNIGYLDTGNYDVITASVTLKSQTGNSVDNDLIKLSLLAT
jgi:hypothetical protein